jgi:hypothetical protein
VEDRTLLSTSLNPGLLPVSPCLLSLRLGPLPLRLLQLPYFLGLLLLILVVLLIIETTSDLELASAICGGEVGHPRLVWYRANLGMVVIRSETEIEGRGREEGESDRKMERLRSICA